MIQLNRRQLIAGSAALAATGALAAPPAKRSLPAVGLQLYTLRELFAPDPLGTLEKVAELGYREVEFGGAGYESMDHAKLRAAMDRLGLASPSLHVGYATLGTQPDKVADMARTLGADTVIIPYMDEASRTQPAWSAAVANMNRYAERLKRAGLGFAYHNHDFEFTQKPGGTSLFDILVEERDPALMKIELDLFWAVHAGEDPIAIIRRLPGQIYAYHVKDRAADGAMTSVGKGMIDFAEIFALNDIAGAKHFYVENDRSPAPYLPDIQTSIATLRALRF